MIWYGVGTVAIVAIVAVAEFFVLKNNPKFFGYAKKLEGMTKEEIIAWVKGKI